MCSWVDCCSTPKAYLTTNVEEFRRDRPSIQKFRVFYAFSERRSCILQPQNLIQEPMQTEKSTNCKLAIIEPAVIRRNSCEANISIQFRLRPLRLAWTIKMLLETIKNHIAAQSRKSAGTPDSRQRMTMRIQAILTKTLEIPSTDA